MVNEQTVKIGMIGLDTSHVTAFTELLNNRDHPYHVGGGTVAVAYPGGSPDFELSYSRVEGFTEKLREAYQVQIVHSPEEAAASCDAIFLESVDGRVHRELFERIAPYRKPVFVDKPFALNAADAQAIFATAEQYGFPVMSCSAVRYAEALTQAIADEREGSIIGVDCYGPMALQPTQPGLFWYGIHTVDMLFSALGSSCVEVKTATTEEHDAVIGVWDDGRIGTIRGNRRGNNEFGVLLHREKGTQHVDLAASAKPYYASLLEKIMAMIGTGTPGIRPEETVAIIRFIEAANESRQTGEAVRL
ncbi:Gfo/Idh/MocA family protein [Paenibacillus methanolicus]|uniref:Putative dehydrogenase n=1 Tax=Paenibacillus methanolicus TaxID=582686 RepID=A0A5S5CHX3_9BACL|nr:Gfo/Idh/MocA family oxidoreductase [Paenibacillus methanolicus]TYP79396.1 putative dehydrogenase [Paenibacillus methanolicus]